MELLIEKTLIGEINKEEKAIERIIHLPYKDYSKAKKQANKLYKEGYLNVKVVEIEERVLYTPMEN